MIVLFIVLGVVCGSVVPHNMAGEEKRLRAFVSGKVQGVWYRKYTAQKATQLGLVGWCRNLDDGRVEVVAEGAEEQLKKLSKWFYQGSPLSKVKDVEIIWEAAKGEYTSFEVRQ